MSIIKTCKSVSIAATAAVTIFLAGATNPASAANKLEDAFASIFPSGGGFSQGAQSWQTSSRSGYDLGSGRIYYGGRSSVRNLVTFTPPSVSVGCNGIDWHFGGISWIEWSEIEQMFENAVRAAPYMVMNLVIKAISESLGSSLVEAFNALRNATKMGADSCQMAQWMANAADNWAGDALGYEGSATGQLKNTINDSSFVQGLNGFSDSLGESMMSRCESSAANTPAADDTLDARKNTCSDLASAWNQLARIGQPQEQEQILTQTGANSTCNSGATSAGSAPEGHPENRDPGTGCDGLNCTWQAIKQVGLLPGICDPARETEFKVSLALAELLQSMVGFRWGGFVLGVEVDALKTHYNAMADGLGERAKHQRGFSGVITDKHFIGVLMCGSDMIKSGGFAQAESTVRGGLPTAAPELASVQDQMLLRAKASLADVCSALVQPVVSPAGDGEISATEPDGLYVWACADPKFTDSNGNPVPQFNLDAKDTCRTPYYMPAKAWADMDYVEDSLGKGLYVSTMEVMLSIYWKLVEGTATLTEREMTFLANAPFPLYRLLSLAAAYPEASSDFVIGTSHTVAAMLAEAYVKEVTRDMMINQNPSVSADMTNIATLNSALNMMMSAIAVETNSFEAQFQKSIEFRKRIELMETAMSDAVYGRGLVGNYAFTQEAYQAVHGYGQVTVSGGQVTGNP